MVWAAIGLMMIVEAYALYRQFTMTQPQQPLQGFTMPTAAEGIAIPVVFGTREITAPNCCWFGDTSVTDYTDHFGKNFGYGYNMGLMLAICHGKLDSIIGISIAGKSYLPTPITADNDNGSISPSAFFPTDNPNDDHVYGGGQFRLGSVSSAVVAGVT